MTRFAGWPDEANDDDRDNDDNCLDGAAEAPQHPSQDADTDDPTDATNHRQNKPTDSGVDSALAQGEQEQVSRLDADGLHLVLYRLTEHDGEVELLAVAVLRVPGPDEDPGPDQDPGDGDGDDHPQTPAPDSGLDNAHTEPAPTGGLLTIYEILDIT